MCESAPALPSEMRLRTVVTLIAALALFAAAASAGGRPGPARAAAASTTTWTLVQVACPQDQIQVGRGCLDQKPSGWEVSDGSATYTDSGHQPPTYHADYRWTLPGAIVGSGSDATLSTTAHDNTNNSGLNTQICLTGGFQVQGGGDSCDRAFARAPGSTDAPPAKTLTLLPSDAAPGTLATVSIEFGVNVTYTYRASASTPPRPAVERIPAPPGFDRTVSAPEPPPGGAAIVTSPKLALFGAVQAPVAVDVENLSIRDQIVFGAKHRCFVQFVKALQGVAAGRLVNRANVGLEALEQYQALALSDLAQCLAIADSLQQQLYSKTAVAARASCSELPIRLSVTGSGRRARIRSARFGDGQPPLRATCTRTAHGLHLSLSTRSRRTPLSRIVGPRLRLVIVRARTDPRGGRLRIAFRHG